MDWNPSQREAIEARNCNILVSAAAGSGKTAVLVERIKQLILSDQVPLDRMLIVTFSNAAAAEMKERIRDALTKAIEEQPDSDFLRKQTGLLSKANISTFHAFAMEVLRRYFHLIDLEPGFRICDESQKSILERESMDQLFLEQFQGGDSAFFTFLKKYASSKNEEAARNLIAQTHRFIQSLPDPMTWLAQQIEALQGTEEEFLVSPLWQERNQRVAWLLSRMLRCMEQVQEILASAGVASLERKSAGDLQLIETLIARFEEDQGDGFQQGISQLKFATFKAAKEDQEVWEEVKAQVTVLRDKAKALQKRILRHYAGRTLAEYFAGVRDTYQDGLTLQRLIGEYDRIYQEKKRDKGVLDFSDLEHLALAVLRHEGAAGEYRDKFHYIFVDEYQDSNLVQETLIQSIARENNVFLVGDVKQSIYKFRLAEPELFLSKYDTYARAVPGEKTPRDRRIDLSENFRSKGGVIDSINDIFRQVMTRQTAGLSYDQHAALNKGLYRKDESGALIGPSYPEELEYPVELHLVQTGTDPDQEIEDGVAEMKRTELEAYTACQLIRDALGKPIYDQKKKITRPVELRDIVILLRGTRTDAPIYADQLRQHGYPAFLDSSDGYFDTLEIEVFLNLLRILDNRKQDIPLLSVLRSQIFGFTIQDLIQIRTANTRGRGAFYQAFSDYASLETPLAARCSKVLSDLARYRLAASVMPLDEFLWLLLRETGYYDLAGALPGGVQRQANLRALVEKAMQFQQAHLKGLFGFLLYMEAIRKNKVSTGQIKLLGENDNVVRIMTVHKSKGLEFPVVIVGGLGKRFNNDNQTAGLVSLHKSLGLGLRQVDLSSRSYQKTIYQSLIEEKNGSERLAEEMRILYVALTRAMDRLILLGCLPDIDKALEQADYNGEEDLPDGKSYLDWILPALPGTKIQLSRYDRSGVSVIKRQEAMTACQLQTHLADGFPLSTQDLEVLHQAETSVEHRSEQLTQRLLWSYPYSVGAGVKSKYSVSEINQRMAGMDQGRNTQADRREKQKKAGPAALPPENSLSPAQRGTILHRVMEHLDFSATSQILESQGPAQAKDQIQTDITRLLTQGHLTEQEAEAADSGLLLTFFQSGMGKRAGRALHLRKEIPFNLKLSLQELPDFAEETSGDSIIVQGTIDCCFEEEDGLVLLDYKSNYIGAENQEERVRELTETYRGQISLYRRALEEYSGREVKAAYLYLFGIGREIEIPV